MVDELRVKQQLIQTEYQVTLATAVTGKRSIIVSGLDLVSGVATRVIEGLKENTLYHFTIRAYNKSGWSDDSASVDIRTAKDTTAGLTENWPIHSMFVGMSETNPNILLGFGTWSSIASGNLVIGATTLTVYAWERTA